MGGGSQEQQTVVLVFEDLEDGSPLVLDFNLLILNNDTGGRFFNGLVMNSSDHYFGKYHLIYRVLAIIFIAIGFFIANFFADRDLKWSTIEAHANDPVIYTCLGISFLVAYILERWCTPKKSFAKKNDDK